MKFRWKIQLLLLAISLPPVVLVAILYHVSTTDLGADLASKNQTALAEDAYTLLHRIVDDYGKILSREKQSLELAVAMQALEVERRLAGNSGPARPVFITNDSVKSEVFQRGLAPSLKIFSVAKDGRVSPMLVNYHDQVFHLAPNVNPSDIATDISRLSSMTDAYKFLYSKIPNLITWQYTGLESGLISNFPGVAAFPRDFDPRTRPWYQNAKAHKTLYWGEPYVDALSGNILLTLSQPVSRADGSFAGVTSIDFPFEAIYQEMILPTDWAPNAEIMLVTRDDLNGASAGLNILVSRSYQALKQPWQSPVKMDLLISDNSVAFAKLINDTKAGRSGVRRMNYAGVDSLWAYGTVGPGNAFPVIILPYDFVVAQAADNRIMVIEMTMRTLRFTAIILFFVVVTVTTVAFLTSRSVTRPIRKLAEAAVDLANGDYQATVEIKTGGELAMLSRVFNAMGPRLKERERMQASLALAKTVQQYLLPTKTPEMKNFELYGSCTFCEEVGGDYYDFVDSTDLNPGKFGIAVGDVCGHGVGAALLMATVRGGLHSLVSTQHDDLGSLFQLLNLNLLRSSGQEQFMTLFFGLLDDTERSFRWASGGHGPCFWMQNTDKTITELSTTGIPLGILEDTEYGQVGPIVLAADDLLIIGTDGLWEAQNPEGELFGIQRFIELLSGCWGMSAVDVHARVLMSIDEFSESLPPTDDITLVVLKAR